jgi:hypothetical protein
MDRYRRALEEFAQDKAPSSPEVARIQQAARRAAIHRRPLPRRLLAFAYGGWAVAALVAGVFLVKTAPRASRGLITQDPSLVERARVPSLPLPPRAASEEAPPLAPQPHCTPQIRAFAPSRAQALQPTTFTLSGTCLPATLHLLMPDCAPVGSPQRTDTAIAFTCTPAVGSGKRSGILRERPEGPSLFSFVYEVQAAAAPGSVVAPGPLVAVPVLPAVRAPEPLPVSASSVALPAVSVALPPLPRQRAALDELLRASKAHVFRLEAVNQVTRDTRGGAKSAEEQACFDQKLRQLSSPLDEARQRLARLEAASQSGDLPAAEPEADRIASLRQAADRVYLDAQRCLRLDD